ncbi:MAG: hypothetical protein IKH09_04060, partial [Clostridia bacterium]|nr:hypothetical protein [Clostridia bacterium]
HMPPRLSFRYQYSYAIRERHAVSEDGAIRGSLPTGLAVTSSSPPYDEREEKTLHLYICLRAGSENVYKTFTIKKIVNILLAKCKFSNLLLEFRLVH